MTMRVRTREEYRRVLESFIDGWNGVQGDARPVTIYRNGAVGSPGVSDLDLILVFSDEFRDGEGFRTAYDRILASIPDAPFYWVHDPILLPRRLMSQLPTFSLNNPSDWELAMGEEIKIEQSHPDSWQSKLISLEFLQMRLVQWVAMQQSSSPLDQRGLLLRGHSLIHSLELARRAGVNLIESNFKALGIVETLRETISGGDHVELSGNEKQKLLQGLIRECHIIYRAFSESVASSVHFYLPGVNDYLYQQGLECTKLFEEHASPMFQTTGTRGQLEGFHWVNRFLRDLYFLPRGELSMSMDVKLRQAIEDRSRFIREVWRWNATIFGTIHAGLGISPGVTGGVAAKWASRYWGISTQKSNH